MDKYANRYREVNEKNRGIKGIFSFFFNRKVHLIFGLLLIGISVFLFISFISYFSNYYFDQSLVDATSDLSVKDVSKQIKNIFGYIGAKCAHYFIFQKFGIASFLVVALAYSIGHKLVFKLFFIKLSKFINAMVWSVIWVSLLVGYLSICFPNLSIWNLVTSVVVYEKSIFLYGLMGHGILILLIFSFIIFVILTFDIDSLNIFKENNAVESFSSVTNTEGINVSTFDVNENSNSFNDIELNIDSSKDNVPSVIARHDFEIVDTNFLEAIEEKIIDNSNNASFVNYDPTLDLSGYKYPTANILSNHGDNNLHSVTHQELEKNKDKIVETLTNFKIGISSIKATIGPTVTLYEIIPDAGIKISKIKNLEDDIALSLAALGIRIIAPIPGKGTIGIEVPNKNRRVVSFKSVVSSEKFSNCNFDLPIIIGKSISNEDFIYDLASMPHLLIAGATGQGKSVGLNVVLSSLIYKKHPSQLKFVLIDPKKVELSLYNKLERHFLAKLPNTEEPIITETKHVINTLNSLCIEMDTRYELLKEAGTRNIKEYNDKFINRKLDTQQGHRFMPYIVLVIDEFADMMITAGKEVETPIARLAQLARAIGIHLVLATQRPSVNVITGTIKANFPARISFKVASKIDSRTILDTGGADQLVGRGDMLLSLDSNIIRLQCPFIDTQEVETLCDYIGSQRGYKDAYILPTYDEGSDYGNVSLDPSERDSLFEEAAKIIVAQQQGSTSLIQRKLKIGYNRAGRIIDQMEQVGIVGPFEGSKAREVLIHDEGSLYALLNSMKNE